MKIDRWNLAVMLLVATLLAAGAGRTGAQSSASEPPVSRIPVGQLSSFRAIAVEALNSARSGDLSRARERVGALEAQWRQAEPRLRLSPQRREAIEAAIDRAERELRFWRVRRTDSTLALETLVRVMAD